MRVAPDGATIAPVASAGPAGTPIVAARQGRCL